MEGDELAGLEDTTGDSDQRRAWDWSAVAHGMPIFGRSIGRRAGFDISVRHGCLGR